MNVTKLPKVRDMTRDGPGLPIHSDGAPVYDLLLTVWAVFDQGEAHEGYELGPQWFTDLAAATDEELASEIVTLGGRHGMNWLALLGMAASAPSPHDTDHILDWLAGLDPGQFRLGLLSYECHSAAAEDPALVTRAVLGDVESLEQLLAESGVRGEIAEHYRAVFALPEGELRDRMVAALRRFRTEVYLPFEEVFGAATARAAAANRALVQSADPERVIEEVTNGAEYRIQPGVMRMVLVPSVVLRPWAIIDRYEHTLVVVHAVADEFIAPDPDAPPSWLVKLHKALGDDRRLRILRRLSDGPASLDDLTEMLGLTKSTVHHHLGMLRAAGLVRVRVDKAAGTKNYTSRPNVLPEAQRSLGAYLRSVEDAPTRRVRNER